MKFQILKIRIRTPKLLKFSFFLFFLSATLSVAAYEPPREAILSYHSDIQVSGDGSLTVTESIQVQSGQRKILHGIYRDFPTEYQDKLGNHYSIYFTVNQITRDGTPENYWIEPRDNGKRIYMGRADYPLPPGIYTYNMTYQTGSQLGFFKDHDELYWNVTGNGWEFPIDSASATVALPSGARILFMEGYTGAFGGKGKDLTVQENQFGQATFRTTRRLNSGEGLTIVVGWPKGIVAEPTKIEKIEEISNANSGTFIGFLGLVFLLFYYLCVWSKVGKDPARGPIVPLFEPPEHLSPSRMSYILHMGYDEKSLTAAIINLAVKGYIKISEEEKNYILFKGKEYTLVRLGNHEDLLTPEEKKLTEVLLGSIVSLPLSNDYCGRFQSATEEFKKALEKSCSKIYFLTNRVYLIPGLVFSLLLMAILIHFLPPEKSEMAVTVVGLLGFWMFSCFYSGHFLSPSLIFGAAFCFTLFEWISLPFMVILGIAVLINGLFFKLMMAPTLPGRRLMDQIEGFKMFLSTAEKDRLNVLNPPNVTPEIFEKYLPYAYALGVDQKWAEIFAASLAAAGMAANYRSSWYSGSSNTFFPQDFTSSVGSSLSSAISSASTPPGSSSGVGGGGSSGGGGGGGGGGGW